MRKLLIFALFVLCLPFAAAQNGAIQRFCDNGANQALTSGLQSSNYNQGEIPVCTVAVYYTGTTNLAPIYSANDQTATIGTITVLNGGSYSICPTGVTISGGSGTDGAATVACSGSAISSVTVTNPGSGYQTPPSVSFTGGTGSGATTVVNLVGSLTNPFQANTDASYLFFSLINQGLDITMSGGYPPNAYTTPRTIIDIFPTQSLSPVSGVTELLADTPIEVNGGQGPATGSVTVSCPTCSGSGSLIMQNVPPITGQFVVLYPNSATSTGTQTCTGGSTSAISSVDTSSPFSGSINRKDSNPTACPQIASITWDGATLPSYVTAANVTAIYGGYVSSTTCSLNSTSNCGFWHLFVNGSSVQPGGEWWPLTTYTGLLCGGSCTGFDYSALQWVAENDSSLTWIGDPPYGGTGTFLPVLYVYYTGTAPPVGTQVQVAPPLNYNQSTLSLNIPFDVTVDTGTSTAYTATIPWYTSFIQPGTEIKMDPENSSTTTTPTLALNGGFALPIESITGGALCDGDIAANEEAIMVFNPDGAWRLQNGQVCGGGSGGIEINGTPLSGTVNFNSNSPSPDADFIANTYKVSGNDVITETPYATDSSFGVIEPDGTSCDVTSGVLSCTGSGGVSGQAAGVIGIATGATDTGAQSHIDEITSGQDTVNQKLAVNDPGDPSEIVLTPDTHACTAVGGAFAFCPSDSLATGSALQGPDAATSGDNLYYFTDTSNVLKMKKVTLGGTLTLSGGTLADSPGSSSAWTNITGTVTATGCSVSGGACAVSGSTTTTVEFSAIPGTYNQIQLVAWGESTASAYVQATFNSDTSAHYALQGYYVISASSVAANTVSSGTSCSFGQLFPTVASTFEIDIPFYANTSFGKVGLSHSGAYASISSPTSNQDQGVSCVWNQTSAITSVTLTMASGDMVAGTEFEILGQQ